MMSAGMVRGVRFRCSGDEDRNRHRVVALARTEVFNGGTSDILSPGEVVKVGKVVCDGFRSETLKQVR
jgi:hypothetical protein